jgi:DNA-binding transcriptional ArsR family regulator
MSPKRFDSSLAKSAPIFAALGDELRLRIIARLVTGGPQSITALTRREKVTRQAVTKHLHVLEGAGLLCRSRQGREQQWAVELKPMDDARRCLAEIAAQWDNVLGNLKHFLENDAS